MSLSEFDLIYRYFSAYGRGEAVELSVGDDCAILSLEPGERLATSVDTMVEDVHFPADSFPEDIGFRVVSAAVSDLAAMGARPLGMTLALTLPHVDELWLQAFSQGLSEVVSLYELPLIGGDTTRGSLAITIQVLGGLPGGEALLRSGAKPGDQVLVSGTLGDAAAGLAFLRDEAAFAPDQASYLLERFNRPRARLELGRSLLGKATAAIDVSDGLLADVGHIAAASDVKVELLPDALPLSPALAEFPDQDLARQWALTGGDDYELCFCLPPGEAIPADCHRIGTVAQGQGVDCGSEIDIGSGYQHF